MDVLNRWKVFFCVSFLFVPVLLSVPVPCLQAKDSPISSVLETAKALVDIQSVNAAVMSGKPRGFIDKATGQILITKKVRPVGYTRSGSGVIIDARGIIVTNAHTIQNAGGLVVTLFDGARAPVKDAYLVPGTDIAFLWIEPPYSLTAMPFADSDQVVKGVNVYTIGHSQWLKGTVIGGKIVKVQRKKSKGNAKAVVLQLNFDMEKGDSGCPVIDARGGLLGIIAASFVGRNNATLAIPSNIIGVAYRDYLEAKMPSGASGAEKQK